MMKVLSSKPVCVFLLGLFVHFGYLLVVFNSEGSVLKGLFRADGGDIASRLSSYTMDTRSYIEVADNYLEYGIFGHGLKIDSHRTVGYPLLIAFAKSFFGKWWYLMMVILQAVIAGLVYPVLFYLGRMVAGLSQRLSFIAVLFIMVSGTFFVRVPLILTDLLFAVFLLIGLFASFQSVIKMNWLWALLGILLISFSALIRPTLSLYAGVAFLLLFAVALKHGTWRYPKAKVITITSSFVLCLSTNYNSIRMYEAHRIFTPTDILSINMFTYSTQSILNMEGADSIYKKYEAQVAESLNLIEKEELRRKFFVESVKKYPLSAFRYWSEAASNHLMTSHWLGVGAVFKAYKNTNSIVRFTFYFFFLFNLFLIVIPFSAWLAHLFWGGNRLLSVAILCHFVLLIAPTFIASTGERMRIPVEPFMVFGAVGFLFDAYQKVLSWFINSK